MKKTKPIKNRNKLFLKLLFKLINIPLAILFILSLVWFCLYQFWFIKTPEFLPGMYDLGIIVYNLVNGYIAGYIIYFLTFHIAWVQKKMRVEFFVHNKLTKVHNDLTKFFEQIAPGYNNGRVYDITILEKGLRNINPKMPFQFIVVRYSNFWDFYEPFIDDLLKTIREVLIFQDGLSQNLLYYVIKLEAELSMRYNKMYRFGANTDITFLSSQLERLPFLLYMISKFQSESISFYELIGSDLTRMHEKKYGFRFIN